MTLIDREALRKNDARALRALAETCSKRCRAIAGRLGIPSDGDDIAQDVMLAFLKANATPREKENDIPVEAFISQVGRRVGGMRLKAAKRMHGFSDDQSIDDFVEHAMDVVGDNYDTWAAEQSKTSQAARIQQQDNAIDRSAAEGNRRTAKAGTKKESNKSKKLTGRKGNILHSVRVQWGLSQAQAAAQTGVSVRAYRNYEYMPENAVPRRVVSAARALHHRMEERGYAANTRALFEHKLAEWLHLLGLAPDDYRNLADFLGLARSTTWRWFEAGATPSRRRIDAIDMYVHVAHQRREEILREAIRAEQKGSK